MTLLSLFPGPKVITLRSTVFICFALFHLGLRLDMENVSESDEAVNVEFSVNRMLSQEAWMLVQAANYELV